MLDDLVESAETGKINKAIVIYGSDSNSGYAIVGLETLNDITEAIGNLEMVKTHLTLSVLEDIHSGE